MINSDGVVGDNNKTVFFLKYHLYIKCITFKLYVVKVGFQPKFIILGWFWYDGNDYLNIY